jgi:hypothetical protein
MAAHSKFSMKKYPTVGVYTRTHPAHAWRFEQQCGPESAEIARQLNEGWGGVETLIVPPVNGQFQVWLCATMEQADIILP